jgi:hypothetical protein
MVLYSIPARSGLQAPLIRIPKEVTPCVCHALHTQTTLALLLGRFFRGSSGTPCFRRPLFGGIGSATRVPG